MASEAIRGEILFLAKKHFNDIVRIRRDIHEHPEVGFNVERTAALAASEMKKLGLVVKEKIGRTGVYADLIVDPNFPTIALRAELDALPMDELGEPVYKSKIAGAAHMCGHDAHTAMLIGAARIILALKKNLRANVRFVFQPNEEALPGGAPAMIEDGVLEGVKEIFALHVMPFFPTGQIGVTAGPIMAQPDSVTIKITGQGGHAAAPQFVIDPIVVAAHFISQAQTIIARNVDPLESVVLSFTQIEGGSAYNVIPDSVVIKGTVRTLKSSVQQMVKSRLQKLLAAQCEIAGAKFTIDYEDGYPAVVNAFEATAQVVQNAREMLGEAQVRHPIPPIMAGEDFAFYGQKIPACFYFLGIRNEEKGITRMCHDSRFDVDEDCFITGMSLHAGLVLR